MKKFILLILIILIENIISINREIIVILGCSVNEIQQERVEVGIEYIKRSKVPNVLFLTGGRKDKNSQLNDEASLMYDQISEEGIRDITIVIDDKAKNTAENFLNLREWVNSNYQFDIFDYVIVTSDFHKKRASLLFNGIFMNVEPKWVLSHSKCERCWNDENIHMRNVKSDIMNALNLCVKI